MIKGKEPAIAFHYMTEPFSFRNRTELKRFLVKLLQREGKALEHINYIFCGDEEILRVNKQYLDHNFYTDIITFELSQKGTPLLADIYISIDRVRDNAKTFNVSFTLELYRVMFHGALHLCGYKDKSRAEVSVMRRKEEEYLNMYVPRGINR